MSAAESPAESPAESIYFAALAKEAPEERAAYLDKACGGDADLRRRVERLLEAQPKVGSFLQGALGAAAPGAARTAAAPQEISETAGAVIGPYKLLQQIGEGGMGVVWMAEQTEPVKRKVALKVIKPGMDSRQVIARFEAERQALAMMDHVNIARVFDGGTTDSPLSPVLGGEGQGVRGYGRPYFVMELVHGVPITKYCDDNHLTPRERLELFVPVCQAIQHAHQKGIIHRDIKPSNVMVTLYDGKPVPKVIDFGVAKATEQKLTERTLFTQYGTMVGTLEYMSPEQAEMSALGVDTRSDIYSLGVLLYELLTGSTPLTHKRMKEAAYAEILRMIKEEEPPRPSTRLSDSGEALASISANRQTEPAKLTKLVRGELDWIVMKCLEKDRNRRYETANGFAADVQRYLADEPVQACPPSMGYRFRKFARRNKAGLAVAALVLFFLVLLGSGVGWAVRDRSAREAEAAKQQAERHAKVAGQVELILHEVEDLQRKQEWPQALAVAKRAEAALANGEADPAKRERVHQVLTDLEMVARLEELRAEAMLARLTTELRPAADRKYAEAFHDYGIDVEKRPIEEAVQRIRTRPGIASELTAALDFWAFVRTEPDAGGGRVTAVAQAADADPWRQRVRDAVLRKDWEGLARLAASEEMLRQPPTTLYLLALALNDRGGRAAEGEAVLRHAQRQHPSDYWINHILGIWLLGKGTPHLEECIGFMRAAVAVRPQSSKTFSNLGNALMKAGKPDEAMACYKKAIELDPKNARGHGNLGITLAAQGRLNDAIASFRAAIAIDPKFAHAHYNLGSALRRQNNMAEAIAAFRKAIEVNPNYTEAYNNLGAALGSQKKLAEAIAAYRKAVELDPKAALAHNNLGGALGRQGKLDEAIAFCKKAIELDPKYAPAHSNLGNVLRRQHKLDEAIACYRKAIELDPKNTGHHNNLSIALKAQGKLDEAILSYRKAIELDPKHAAAHGNLGVALMDKGKLDEAIACYKKAIELEPKDAGLLNNLGIALYEQKNLPEAIVAYHKAIEIDPKHANAYGNLGNALRNQRKLPEAIAAYHKAIEINPKHASGYNGLGNALYSQKKLDEAIACYRTAIELDPKFVLAHCNLGVALAVQGKLDEAIACFRRAIDLNPTLALAHYQLGSSLEAQGKHNEAIASYRKAVELDPKHAKAHNNVAWLLATCADAKLRDPVQAVTLAKKAVEIAPKVGIYQNTLGVAYYRAEDWKAAMGALEKSMQLRKGGDSSDWFFLAMANWQLGANDKARVWYDLAVQWMDKNQPNNEQLRRFRAEAAELLGVD